MDHERDDDGDGTRRTMIAMTARTARTARDGQQPVEAGLRDNDSGASEDSATRARTAR